MYSKTLAKKVTLADVTQIDEASLPHVIAEATERLVAVNAEIKALGSHARATQSYAPSGQWQDTHKRRARLATLHQSLLARQGIVKRERQGIHDLRRPSLAEHFMQVAKVEALPADYQRWMSQAGARCAGAGGQ